MKPPRPGGACRTSGLEPETPHVGSRAHRPLPSAEAVLMLNASSIPGPTCSESPGYTACWAVLQSEPTGPAASHPHLPGALRTPSHRADELSPRTKFLPPDTADQVPWPHGRREPALKTGDGDSTHPCLHGPQAGLPGVSHTFHTLTHPPGNPCVSLPLECNQCEGRLQASAS